MKAMGGREMERDRKRMRSEKVRGETGLQREIQTVTLFLRQEEDNRDILHSTRRIVDIIIRPEIDRLCVRGVLSVEVAGSRSDLRVSSLATQ